MTKVGFGRLLDLMIREVSLLRKTVSLRVPQSQYGLISEALREGNVVSTEYDGNDILLEVEIPKHLEQKVAHFEVAKESLDES